MRLNAMILDQQFSIDPLSVDLAYGIAGEDRALAKMFGLAVGICRCDIGISANSLGPDIMTSSRNISAIADLVVTSLSILPMISRKVCAQAQVD